MSRPCTVCNHPEISAINAALVKGDSLETAGAGRGLSVSALSRHRAEHLPDALIEAKANQDTLQSIDVMAELTRCIERVNLLSDACDAWLRDPDDSTRYFVGPRAEDVKVSYEQTTGEGPNERTVRRKAPLSELLARLEKRYTVTAVETKHADPRELLLKAFQQQQSRLELVAKLLGQIDERPIVNLHLSVEYLAVRAAIVEALAPYPEARGHVAAVLSELETSGQ